MFTVVEITLKYKHPQQALGGRHDLEVTDSWEILNNACANLVSYLTSQEENDKKNRKSLSYASRRGKNTEL